MGVVSRTRTGPRPQDWRDDGPATPYSGPRARIGGTIVVALARKPPATWIPTPGDVARNARSHAAYRERQRAAKAGAA